MLKNLVQYIKAAAGTRSAFGVTAVVIVAVMLVLIFTVLSHMPALYILIIVLVGFFLLFVIYVLHFRHVSRWPPGLTEDALKAALRHGYTISGTSTKLLPPDQSQTLPSTQNQPKALPPGKGSKGLGNGEQNL